VGGGGTNLGPSRWTALWNRRITQHGCRLEMSSLHTEPDGSSSRTGFLTSTATIV
jgi:hypothetical protein